MFETFHFLRPEWLIALPFAVILLIILLKRSNKSSGWENVCDPALLQYQMAQQPEKKSGSLHLLSWTVPFIFLISIFALAGPAWEKKEQPVFQQGNALVIILDLSLSMNAGDIKPSRLERAKLKLIDILKQKKEGQTALIAFAGDAHTVSPLTIDNKTIMSLLPALDSSIMPLAGSHLSDALTTARELLINAGFARGDILLLSDGIDPSQQRNLQNSIKNLHQQGYRFSVIGIGTQAGSPIPIPGQGGFMKDQSGQVILSKLVSAPLKKLAAIGGGSYNKLSLDDSDFHDLLVQKVNPDNDRIDQDKLLEQWLDTGSYFTLLLIPLALSGFRKGLFSVVLCLFAAASFFTEPVYAEAGSEAVIAQLSSNDKLKKYWKNLWSTTDQQGQKSFDAKDYQAAASSFSDNSWKASANYRAGNFEQALQQYTQSDTADSLYNKGNTLANMNKLQEAIKAYEEALEKAPEANTMIKKSANQNLEYLKELLAQQEKQSSEKDSDQQQDDSEQQSEDQEKDQKNSSDDASKSNESNSDDSEQKDSENSTSEGAESGEKQEESSDSENESDTQEQEQNSQNEDKPSDEPDSPDKSKSPDEPKSADESNPVEDKKEQNPQEESMQQAQSEPIEQDEANHENANNTQKDVLSQLSQEEQQSLKQWLQRIPDNPGELLRIKFRNNTLLKQREPEAADARYEGNPW